LILFSVGSGLCAEATSSTTIILGRIVQAVGASASVVLARAIVRDVYSGNQAASMMSVLMTIMACVPLIGPSVGGLILKFGNWQDIFWLLTAIGFLLILALKILPETLPIHSRKTSSIIGALKVYRYLLKDPTVIGYASIGAFFYSAMFAYVSGSPAAYIGYYKVTPHTYGLLFGVAIIGIMLMTQVNAVLVKEYGPHKLLHIGSVGAAITGTLLAINVYHEFNGIVGLISLLVLFTSFAGFIIANSITCAMENHPEDAGSVSALVGAMQYGFGVIGSALVGIFTDGTPVAMCLVICLFGLCTLISACWTRDSHLKGQPS
jgi:MFS transporter, DHA1 family, multidrug resistance protein